MNFTLSLRALGIGFDILEGRYTTGFRIARGWFWLRVPGVGEVQWLNGQWTWDRWSELRGQRWTEIPDIDWRH